MLTNCSNVIPPGPRAPNERRILLRSKAQPHPCTSDALESSPVTRQRRTRKLILVIFSLSRRQVIYSENEPAGGLKKLFYASNRPYGRSGGFHALFIQSSLIVDLQGYFVIRHYIVSSSRSPSVSRHTAHRQTCLDN